MAYELTINRMGAFVAAGVPNAADECLLSGDELIAKFRRQAELIVESKAYHRAEHAVVKIAQRHDMDARCSAKGIGPGEEIEPIEIFPMPLDSIFVPETVTDVSDHLVCLLPSKKIDCTIGGVLWILRIRASMTGCVLERKRGLSKLWWTFEGIPANRNPARRPTEKEAAEFVSVSDEMARAAMEHLYDAFRQALSTVQGNVPEMSLLPDRISISLSDNDDRPVADLLDAMYFQGSSLAEIARSDKPALNLAREASLEFKKFVGDVTGHDNLKLDDRKIYVNDKIAGVRGLIWQYDDPEQRRQFVAGVARRSGVRAGYDLLSPELQSEQKTEGFLRASSAARPLSAMLASHHAILFEQSYRATRPGQPVPLPAVPAALL